MKEAKIFMYLTLGILFATTAYSLYKGEEKPKFEPIQKPPENLRNQTRGWDWAEKEYKYYDRQPLRSSDLSDEEIRILREKQSFKSDGSYIYTPGRKVKSREREIQDYIDDNIDDILDNYKP